eukprot:11194102-Lingulodinium_polyedra.AAC.1
MKSPIGDQSFRSRRCVSERAGRCAGNSGGASYPAPAGWANYRPADEDPGVRAELLPRVADQGWAEYFLFSGRSCCRPWA